jgi:hypothetical protein
MFYKYIKIELTRVSQEPNFRNVKNQNLKL